MMRRLLLILAGSLLFITTSAQSSGRWRLFGANNVEVPSPTAPEAPAPATPAAASKSQVKGAHLNMSVATHNFGDVARKGGDLVKEFSFVNDGTVPLVITRVITSCSCLKASFSKRPIAPGTRGVISITYEPHKSEVGVFNKVIQIYSNSIDVRDVISVQGNSLDKEVEVKIKGDKLKVKIK